METFQVGEYLITSDPLLVPKDPKEKKAVEIAYHLTQKKRNSTLDLKKLVSYAETYPNNPSFKNYVQMLARRSKETSLEKEYERLIEEQHPGYLFGIFSKAERAINNGTYDEVPKLLGENFDLIELAGKNRVFHISEFLSFQALSIRYFLEKREQAEVNKRLGWMEDADPAHPLTEQTYSEVMLTNMERSLESMQNFSNKEDNDGPPIPDQHEDPPEFNHPEIWKLYEDRKTLTIGTFQEILSLPRETLIEDLVLMVKDSIYRFEYYQDKFYDNKSEIKELPLNAFTLLCELGAEKQLDVLLFFLQQNENILEFWLGDTLTEDFWEFVWDLGKNQLQRLGRFLRESGYSDFAYYPIIEALNQMAFEKPELKPEILLLFENSIDELLKNPWEGAITMASEIVCSLVDHEAKHLLKKIKQLYDAELIDTFMCGDYDSIEEDISNKAFSKFQQQKEVRKPLERLEEYMDWWQTWEPLAPSFSGASHLSSFEKPEDDLKYIASGQGTYKRSNPKIGRNDPCPCGSGKKYKKCCLNK